MSNVRRPTIFLRDSKGLHQLPAGKIGTCDVTDLAASDQFMQRLQRFFDRSERVESVDTVDVDVVRMEPAQTRFTRTNQIMSRRTHIIRSIPHWKRTFGKNEHVIPARTQSFAENFLGQTIRIHVSRIEKVHACFQADVDEFRGLCDVAATPRAEEFIAATKRSGAKTQDGDF